jgi:hypothetical protein
MMGGALQILGILIARRFSALGTRPIDVKLFKIAPAEVRLLNGAANLRKHVVGVRSDKPDRPNDDDQNHSQHYRVFRDVLTMFILPKLL